MTIVKKLDQLTAGDYIRISMVDDPEERLEAWVAPGGEKEGLVTFHPTDKQQGSYVLSKLLEDDGLVVELLEPFADTVPTKPGIYRDRAIDDMLEFLRLAADKVGIPFEELVSSDEANTLYRINEDGSLSNNRGGHVPAEEMWAVAAYGLVLEPTDAEWVELDSDEAQVESGFSKPFA